MGHKRVGLLVCRLCLAGLLLFSAGCAVTVTPQKQDHSSQLTLEEERELGQRTYQQIIQQFGGVYPDRDLNIYINQIGQSLVAGGQPSQLEYHFQVLNDSTLNTFSLPGGFIAMTRGLLVKLQSEAQLAAVLSCEIGHVIARHQQRGLSPETLHSRTVNLLDELSAGSDYATLLARLQPVETELVNQQYSPEQETEADRIGLDLMVAAGYPPTAVVEVQEFFLDQLETKDEKDGSVSLFRRHPFSTERLGIIRDYITSRYSQAAGRSGKIDFDLVVAPLRQLDEGYALYDQGRQLERQGRVVEAIEIYHQALQLAPDEALILAGLGLDYLRNNDPVPARRYLLKAVSLQENYSQSRLGLGYVYLQKGQYAQAISQLERSLQLLPTVEAAFLLADAQQNIGQKIKARDLYRIVASADPDSKLGHLAGTRLQQLKGE